VVFTILRTNAPFGRPIISFQRRLRHGQIGQNSGTLRRLSKYASYNEANAIVVEAMGMATRGKIRESFARWSKWGHSGEAKIGVATGGGRRAQASQEAWSRHVASKEDRIWKSPFGFDIIADMIGGEKT
jgi:hypothetical protein